MKRMRKKDAEKSSKHKRRFRGERSLLRPQLSKTKRPSKLETSRR